jgi:hypothetical protein
MHDRDRFRLRFGPYRMRAVGVPLAKLLKGEK